MAKDKEPSILERFESIRKFAAAKPSTAKQLKKADPVAMFFEAYDAQYEAFTNDKEIRGSWVKKTTPGLYFITFGRPAIKFHPDDPAPYQVKTKEEVIEVFETIRDYVTDTEEGKQAIRDAAVAPKPARKPRKAK
ncbi:hypothetical protein RMR21_009520 [Agrobacterium sp. rho-8.1]|nr:hypothetical protein [Agrobacterium sp. rho-8.1]